MLAETRAILRERGAKGDPNWPTDLNTMVQENAVVAEAINEAPAFASGLSAERRQSLVLKGLEAHAPDEMAAMTHHVTAGKEADRMEKGLRKLEQAFFVPTLADRATRSRIDPNAPLVPEPAE